MDHGPHKISLKPGGVPHIIHASQDEFGKGAYIDFYLVKDDNMYYRYKFPDGVERFKNPNGNSYFGSEPAARLICRRPDGETNEFPVHLEYVNVEWSGTTFTTASAYYVEPSLLRITELDKWITEVAGDVQCELVVQAVRASGSLNAERSANFIIRVERNPMAVPLATMLPGTYPDTEEQPEQVAVYYAGDPLDTSLPTWEQVVAAVDAHKADQLLQPGDQIQAIMLTNGIRMGLRAVEVKPKWVVFEPLHLWASPFDNYADTKKYFDNYHASENFRDLLPYGVKNPSNDSFTYITLHNPPYVFGPNSAEYYSTSTIYDSNGQPIGERDIEQFDYFKTQANRIKTSSDGTPQRWVTDQTRLNTQDVIAVSADGIKDTIPEGTTGVFYANPSIYVGSRRENPVDDGGGDDPTLTWAQIKAAVDAGTHDQLLTVGQEMSPITVNDGKGLNETITFRVAHIVKGNTEPTKFRVENMGVIKDLVVFESKQALSLARQMTGGNAANPYEGSIAQNYLLNTVYPALPDDLKAVITPIRFVVPHNAAGGTWDGGSHAFIEAQSLWLSSFTEVTGTMNVADSDASMTDEQFDIYKNEENRKKTYGNNTLANWWTRSRSDSLNGYMIRVGTDGTTATQQLSAQNRLVPCFAIATYNE